MQSYRNKAVHLTGQARGANKWSMITPEELKRFTAQVKSSVCWTAICRAIHKSGLDGRM